MFNLDQAIAEWRRQLSAAGIESRAVLDELESHLREDMERLTRSGSTPEQAFAAAVERIGSACVLKSEFAKVCAPRQRVGPRLATVACLVFAAVIVLANASVFLDSDVSLSQKIPGMTLATLVAMYLACLPFVNRLIPNLHNPRVVATLKVLNIPFFAWPIVALLGAAGLIHLGNSYTVEMSLWTLYGGYGIALVAYGAFGDHHDPFNVLALAPMAPAARESLDRARDEALGLNHDFIGTEHLLLGLFTVEHDMFNSVLKKFNVTPDTVRLEIGRLVENGPVRPQAAAIPYTPRARQALRLAADEARTLKQSQVGPLHLFLGLLAEGSGVAAVALKNLGVRIEQARETIRKDLTQ